MPRREFIWQGDEARPLQATRPCPCGCDERDGYMGVGYLTGSDDEGNGFTVWITNENVFRSLERMLEASHE